jgi:hypothetical protein
MYWYNWFSWWWALGRSKHVQKWNKHIKKGRTRITRKISIRVYARACSKGSMVRMQFNLVVCCVLQLKSISILKHAPLIDIEGCSSWHGAYYLRAMYLICVREIVPFGLQWKLILSDSIIIKPNSHTSSLLMGIRKKQRQGLDKLDNTNWGKVKNYISDLTVASLRNAIKVKSSTLAKLCQEPRNGLSIFYSYLIFKANS